MFFTHRLDLLIIHRRNDAHLYTDFVVDLCATFSLPICRILPSRARVAWRRVSGPFGPPLGLKRRPRGPAYIQAAWGPPFGPPKATLEEGALRGPPLGPLRASLVSGHGQNLLEASRNFQTLYKFQKLYEICRKLPNMSRVSKFQQASAEFQKFQEPINFKKFTESCNVQKFQTSRTFQKL